MTTLHEPTPTRSTAPQRMHSGRIVGGLVLVAVGVAWLAERLDWFEFDAGFVLPVAVCAVGLALLFLSTDSTNHGGLVALGILLVIATFVSGIGFPTTLSVGERNYAPTAVSDVPDRYELAIGDLTVDLTELAVTDTVEVQAAVVFGKITVEVPEGTAIDAQGRVLAGKVVILGETKEGLSVSNEAVTTSPAPGTLVLELSAVAGEIDVVEVDRG